MNTTSRVDSVVLKVAFLIFFCRTTFLWSSGEGGGDVMVKNKMIWEEIGRVGPGPPSNRTAGRCFRLSFCRSNIYHIVSIRNRAKIVMYADDISMLVMLMVVRTYY